MKVIPAPWSWTGGYVGGHVGGGYGQTSFSDPYGPSIYGDVVGTPAFLAGGQIGSSWQKDRWVLGLELAASNTVSDGTNTCLAVSGIVVSANCKAGPDFFVTGTGRLGYAFGSQGHTLAYLKGGVAWQHNSGDVVNGNEFRSEIYPFGLAPQNGVRFDYGRVGSVFGAGIEQALTPAWSVNLEYDYLRFGGPRVVTPPTLQYPPLAAIPPSATRLASSYHISKIGLNYHFGADPRTPGWSDTPLSTTNPIFGTPPIAFAAGWSLESGTRLWLSRGRFQWENGPPYLVSRLTYHKLDGISGELFERVDSPWGIFLKGNIGFGRFNSGQANDEDWGLMPNFLAYTNTSSGVNGKFEYYTADAGYDFLRGSTYRLGAFIGWAYYGEKSDVKGCVTIASLRCLAPGDERTVGSQDTDWNALRIGFSAETMLLDRWRVSADVAYLPWTDFQGRDNHLLRDLTTYIDHRGSGGGGVQIEGALSYLITRNFSVGIGGRYWAMWSPRDSEQFSTQAKQQYTSPVTSGPYPANYRMERWGTFLQASYRFD
ncbi:outer membrane beta-barrel protein [Bradyrhizobium centrolobii]|uniref:outer membrane beta-barrel protein n=1 Tax=Bradyrhizobium centrolobii TaxID=1505087 RepID=UPI001FD999CA|nr:outer membrane beta-barrel protein [Bradyrhizobium centrolobii]